MARRLAPVLALVLLACGGGGDDISSSEHEASLASAVSAAGCATAVADALSRQIMEEMACMSPGHFAMLEPQAGIEFAGSAVYGLITAEGKTDLLAAVASRGGMLRINSGFRTVAQQYLLYRWWQNGQCGITAAATPGRSNHESGRALDIGNYGEWKATLESHGWAQTVPGDPVHFDHAASGDSRGMDVHAFQRLWNRNHPSDTIDEDGVYGAQTADRLAAAPAEAFPIGACDGAEPEPEPEPEPQPEPEPEPQPEPGPMGETGGSDGANLTGGCRAGGSGGSAGWLLIAIGFVAIRRRR